jgi:hypothetical protein
MLEMPSVVGAKSSFMARRKMGIFLGGKPTVLMLSWSHNPEDHNIIFTAIEM